MPEQHMEGRWCSDLHCAKCYAADTWMNSELAASRSRIMAVEEELKEANAIISRQVELITRHIMEINELRIRVQELEKLLREKTK